MKKLAKSARSKGSSRKKGARSHDHDSWGELEAQHDRVKSDWMSLAVQLGVGGGQGKSIYK